MLRHSTACVCAQHIPLHCCVHSILAYTRAVHVASIHAYTLWNTPLRCCARCMRSIPLSIYTLRCVAYTAAVHLAVDTYTLCVCGSIHSSSSVVVDTVRGAMCYAYTICCAAAVTRCVTVYCRVSYVYGHSSVCTYVDRICTQYG